MPKKTNWYESSALLQYTVIWQTYVGIIGGGSAPPPERPGGGGGPLPGGTDGAALGGCGG